MEDSGPKVWIEADAQIGPHLSSLEMVFITARQASEFCPRIVLVSVEPSSEYTMNLGISSSYIHSEG
jgi:hypothetical protein